MLFYPYEGCFCIKTAVVLWKENKRGWFSFSLMETRKDLSCVFFSFFNAAAPNVKAGAAATGWPARAGKGQRQKSLVLKTERPSASSSAGDRADIWGTWTVGHVIPTIKKTNWYQINFNAENECHRDTNTNSFEPLRCHSLIVPWTICHRKQDKHQPCPFTDPQPALKKNTSNSRRGAGGGASPPPPPPSRLSLGFTFNTVLCQ